MGIWVWVVATKALSNNREQSLMGKVIKKIFSTKNCEVPTEKMAVCKLHIWVLEKNSAAKIFVFSV